MCYAHNGSVMFDAEAEQTGNDPHEYFRILDRWNRADEEKELYVELGV